MERLLIPKNYESELDLHDTQIAIKTIKDFFQGLLAQRLRLARVSAPLFVDPTAGLNDNLNGYERPVSFGIKEQDDKPAEVVHSLAKWKRYALKKYGFTLGEGIYTDMNAIRRDEDTDNIHSIFVDQWDWEKVIAKEDRHLDYLKETVRTIYKCLRKTEQFMAIQYDYIDLILPKEIFFITSQELLDILQTFETEAGSYGYGFDLEEAKELVEKAQPGEVLRIPMEYIAPEILDNDAFFQDTLGEHQTRGINDENRNANLQLACKALNGTILNPGESLSFGSVLNKASGFRMAPEDTGHSGL